MKTPSRVIVLFSPWFSAYTRAAESSVAKPALLADTSGYFLQLVSGLGVVLLSIIALAWLLKRINRLPNRDLKELELIASLSVGQRERVVIVRAGSNQLVLGVAPGNISKLCVMPDETMSAQDQSCVPNDSLKNSTPTHDTDRDELNKNTFSTLIAKVCKDAST